MEKIITEQLSLYDKHRQMQIAANCTSDLSFLKTVLEERKLAAEIYFKSSSEKERMEAGELVSYYNTQIKIALGLD